MKTDFELKFLKNARNEDFHRNPIPYRETRSFQVTFTPNITEQRERREKKLPYIPQRMNTSDHITEKRFFPEMNNEEICDFCNRQISKLDNLVLDWKRKLREEKVSVY